MACKHAGDLPLTPSPTGCSRAIDEGAVYQHVATESSNCIKLYTPRYGRQHQIATVWLFRLSTVSSRATCIS